MLSATDLQKWAENFRLFGLRGLNLCQSAFLEKNLQKAFGAQSLVDAGKLWEKYRQYLTIRCKFLVVKLTYLDSYSGPGPKMNILAEASKQLSSFLQDTDVLFQTATSFVSTTKVTKHTLSDVQGKMYSSYTCPEFCI